MGAERYSSPEQHPRYQYKANWFHTSVRITRNSSQGLEDEDFILQLVKAGEGRADGKREEKVATQLSDAAQNNEKSSIYLVDIISLSEYARLTHALKIRFQTRVEKSITTIKYYADRISTVSNQEPTSMA